MDEKQLVARIVDHANACAEISALARKDVIATYEAKKHLLETNDCPNGGSIAAAKILRDDLFASNHAALRELIQGDYPHVAWYPVDVTKVAPRPRIYTVYTGSMKYGRVSMSTRVYVFNLEKDRDYACEHKGARPAPLLKGYPPDFPPPAYIRASEIGADQRKQQLHAGDGGLLIVVKAPIDYAAITREIVGR